MRSSNREGGVKTVSPGPYKGEQLGELLGIFLATGQFESYVFNVVTRIGKGEVQFSGRRLVALNEVQGGFTLTFEAPRGDLLDWGTWDFVWSLEEGAVSGRPLLTLSIVGSLAD